MTARYVVRTKAGTEVARCRTAAGALRYMERNETLPGHAGGIPRSSFLVLHVYPRVTGGQVATEAYWWVLLGWAFILIRIDTWRVLRGKTKRWTI